MELDVIFLIVLDETAGHGAAGAGFDLGSHVTINPWVVCVTAH